MASNDSLEPLLEKMTLIYLQKTNLPATITPEEFVDQFEKAHDAIGKAYEKKFQE